MSGFKTRLTAWMQGRYGTDELNSMMFWIAVALWLMGLLFNFGAFAVLSSALLVVVLWRTFSRDVGRRSSENERYQQAVAEPRRNASQALARFRNRKTTLYFRCEGCKAWLSVPRGKGSLRVVCPNCKKETFKKS
ncbi:MAG: hypothetical protein IJ087_07185 [Eggerthellaceae bacterium]|nr:hypothetical protein [Eggerthellaceae bacterium]